MTEGWPTDLAAQREELAVVLRDVPFLQELGAELAEWGPGWAKVRLPTGRRHGNLAGTLHGAVLFGVADAAFEAACNSYGRLCVALQTSCHYSAPGSLGAAVEAVAIEITRSRRTASYRIEVHQDGRLLAWYMALAYRTNDWHLGVDRWPQAWRETH